jgi:hypothetical protein
MVERASSRMKHFGNRGRGLYSTKMSATKISVVYLELCGAH